MSPVITYMLTVDGYGDQPESRARRRKLRKEILSELAPAAVRYLSRGYNPAHDPEPAQYKEWLREHEYDLGVERGVA